MKIKIGSVLIIITILLCILKVLNIISISWLWCFIPILIPLILIASIFMFVLIASCIIYIIID